MHYGELPEPVAAHLNWRYEGIVPGGSLKGWIAGPTVGVRTHWNGECTVPCPNRVSKGVLACERCRSKEPRWSGYVPLYVYPDLIQRVIIVSRTIGTVITAFAIGTPVQVSRPTAIRHPSRVRSINPDEIGGQTTKTVSRRKTQDIRAYLCQCLWKSDHLLKYLAPELPMQEAG
jgi:hypothetical protein